MNLPPTGALREDDLKVGQRVVYPNQGVCRISGVETKDIGGVRAEFLTMKREEDGATVMVPRTKLASIGLRHVAQPDEIKQILAFFEAESGDPELDWKVRHRTHADKMTDGSLTGTAEVLKALHSLAERRPLPQKERELYDSARHLVVNEVGVALGVARGTGEDIVDFALTPPAGSSRAAHKARLKADREAAEEAALLDGLDDLSDLEAEPLALEPSAPAEPGAEDLEPNAAEEGVEEAPKPKRPPAKKAALKPAAKPDKSEAKEKPAKASDASKRPTATSAKTAKPAAAAAKAKGAGTLKPKPLAKAEAKPKRKAGGKAK